MVLYDYVILCPCIEVGLFQLTLNKSQPIYVMNINHLFLLFFIYVFAL